MATLEELSSELEGFTGKKSGDLFLPEEWNVLVETVLALKGGFDQLNTRVEDGIVRTAEQVETLRGTVEELRVELDTFRSSVEELIGEQYRLNLSTTRTRYTLGQVAEIEARLTALDGTPLTFAPAERPWVDFVIVWGHLRPVPGSESRGGVDDRSLSVRVDGDGVARVRVRAEQVDGLTEVEEDEVAGALETRLDGLQSSLSDLILDAATPMEADQREAFRVLGREYGRSDSESLRRWVDSYYVRNRPMVECPVTRLPVQRWRDFRSTVLAFAKNDADPLTPDPSRGVGSIQVTFRDWVAPFLNVHYFEEVDDEVQELDGIFTSGIAERLDDSVRNFQDRVKSYVRDKGVVGRQRSFRAINRSLNRLTGTQIGAAAASPPSFLFDLKQTVRGAVSIQRSLDCAKPSEDSEAAVDVFSNAALRTDVDISRVRGDLETQLKEFNQQVALFEQRVGTFESTLGNIDTRTLDFAEKVGRINQLDGRVADFQLTLDSIDQRTAEVPNFIARVDQIDTAVRTLDVRTQQVDAQAADVAARFNTVETKLGNLTGLNAGDVASDLGTLKFQVQTLQDQLKL